MSDEMQRRRDERAIYFATLAAALPTDPEQRRAELVAAQDAYHAAIMGGDEEARLAADERALVVLVALNDCDLFGFAVRDAAPDVMLTECAAKPGTVPTWGQRGDFALTVDAMRVRIVFDPHLGSSMPAHIGLRVVDPGKPFISDTGFWSRWQSHYVAGQTVDEAARALIEQTLAESGRKMLDPQFRERRWAEPVPAWIDAESTPAPAFYEERGGQVAFAF